MSLKGWLDKEKLTAVRGGPLVELLVLFGDGG